VGKFLNWPLQDGTLLGKATKDNILKDAESYRKKAEGNKRNERFLMAVASKLARDQRVEEVFTDDELARLMTRADREGRASAG
jgi:hypothetical protein